MRWHEVSLTVDADQVEVIADLLRDYAYQGVAIEPVGSFDNQPFEDDIPPASRLRLCGYLPDNRQIDNVKREIEELLKEKHLPLPEYRLYDDDEYGADWHINRFAQPVGKHMFICPHGIVKPEQPGEIVIALESGMAFGTGAHATTRMMLEATEELADLLANARVLDLGCGSGVLGIAAARMGATSVLALDIDADSVSVTDRNAAVNGVADRIFARKGSLDSLMSPLEQFDVVLANLIAPIILAMCADNIGSIVRPGGLALFSGIRDYEAERVDTALRSTGLAPYEMHSADGWVAIRARREAPSSATTE
jgi:ribosomal protein L11 methyltransferase